VSLLNLYLTFDTAFFLLLLLSFLHVFFVWKEGKGYLERLMKRQSSKRVVTCQGNSMNFNLDCHLAFLKVDENSRIKDYFGKIRANFVILYNILNLNLNRFGLLEDKFGLMLLRSVNPAMI